jgi:hypothetical protein
MEKVFSKKTLKDSVAELLRCFYDLATLQSGRNGKDSVVESEKKYSPGVELVMELCNRIKGWKIVSQDLYERDGYVAQLWTDKCSCSRVVVILKKNRKGCFPVVYEPVSNEAEVESILKDALRKAVNQCGMQRAA